MQDREPTRIRQLLDRLLSARARRDREVRFSDAWRAADRELQQIERAIFRVPPVERPARPLQPRGRSMGARERRAARRSYGSRLVG